VEYSHHAAPYSSGATGTLLVMMLSSLLIAACWTDALLLPAYWASACWVAGSFHRPMLLAAGLPTGAVRFASRLPS
jgi:hypothetical protein